MSDLERQHQLGILRAIRNKAIQRSDVHLLCAFSELMSWWNHGGVGDMPVCDTRGHWEYYQRSMSNLPIILNNDAPAGYSLYTPIYPRRWYMPLPPRTALLFGWLSKWWYTERNGVVVQLDKPPQVGIPITAIYSVNFSRDL